MENNVIENRLIEREKLTNEVKQLIIETLNLTIEPSLLYNDEPLFGGNLGLDSIDVLQLVVAVNAKMNIEINAAQMNEIRSINTIVNYIEKCRNVTIDSQNIPDTYMIQDQSKIFNVEYNALRNNVLLAVRNDLVVIKLTDVSNIKIINEFFTRDIELIPENTIRTVLLLNKDGTLDDAINIYNNYDHYFITCKKAVSEKIISYLKEKAYPYEDLTSTLSLIELAGPFAKQLVETKLSMAASRLGLLSFTVEQIAETEIIISRQDSVGEFEFLLFFDQAKQAKIIDYLIKDFSDILISNNLSAVTHITSIESGSFFSRMSKEHISPYALGLGVLIDGDKNYLGKENISHLPFDKSLVYFCVMDKLNSEPDEVGKYKIFNQENTEIGYTNTIVYSEIMKKYIGTAFLNLDHAHVGMEYILKMDSVGLNIKTVSAPIVIGKSYLTP